MQYIGSVHKHCKWFDYKSTVALAIDLSTLVPLYTVFHPYL